MKAEISIECDIVTDYDKAVKANDNGKIVWTIFIDDKDRQYYQEKLVKKKGIVGWAIIDKANTEIIIGRRAKWSKK